jgi:hypothetical protein
MVGTFAGTVRSLVIGLLALFFGYGEGSRGGLSSAPELSDSDTVEFYIMTTSFPYDAPAAIR